MVLDDLGGKLSSPFVMISLGIPYLMKIYLWRNSTITCFVVIMRAFDSIHFVT
jgi:hypothetical protein